MAEVDDAASLHNSSSDSCKTFTGQSAGNSTRFWTAGIFTRLPRQNPSKLPRFSIMLAMKGQRKWENTGLCVLITKSPKHGFTSSNKIPHLRETSEVSLLSSPFVLPVDRRRSRLHYHVLPLFLKQEAATPGLSLKLYTSISPVWWKWFILSN